MTDNKVFQNRKKHPWTTLAQTFSNGTRLASRQEKRGGHLFRSQQNEGDLSPVGVAIPTVQQDVLSNN